LLQFHNIEGYPNLHQDYLFNDLIISL